MIAFSFSPVAKHGLSVVPTKNGARTFIFTHLTGRANWWCVAVVQRFHASADTVYRRIAALYGVSRAFKGLLGAASVRGTHDAR